MSYKNDDRLQHDLAHVLWIGGSPATGKSTIARMFARKYGLRVYDYDHHEPVHVARRMDNAADYPAYTSFLALTMDQRWLHRSAEEMATQVIAMWTERFRLVIDDLLTMPAHPPIIAEGSGLFPDCVRQVIADPHQAIWLVPTASFCRAVRLERDAGSFVDTSDPEQAMRNLIERDILLAAYVKRQAASRGLTLLENDGSRSIDEIAAAVTRQLTALRTIPLVAGRQAIEDDQ